jgi:signal transduction histidine kinase
VYFWWRALDLLPETIQEKRMQITEYSIQEAIDSLEEGVLISLASGEPVLMNRALFRYTESVLGVGIRNGNVLWHLLQEVRRPGLLRENQGRGLLFRLPDGRWLLFQRVMIDFQGQSHWQLTASDVTELQRLNQSLDQQNRQLQQKNAELKELLQHVQEIRIRIHDLMGMRISLLQQVLNNRDFADYQRIMPLLVSMLSDVWQEIRVKPQVRLAELVSVYRKLGVLVTVRGNLPEEEWKGELYVQIIREALTNAVCHGRASQVALVLDEENLLIQDNGRAAPDPSRQEAG